MLKSVVILIVVTTLTDRFFLFSPIHCDALGYKLEYSCSYPSLLSVSNILRYIFCPAECMRCILIYILDSGLKVYAKLIVAGYYILK